MPPLSGLVALYGPEIVRAAQIACHEINEQGGVMGRPLELVIEDDGSLPETAIPAAKRLIEDHQCVAIIGNLLSNSRIAVANLVAEPRKVPYLNFSFYEGSISGRYFFHFAALPNQQIEKMIPYMARNFGPKMFFAGNNYEWPRGSIDAAKHALKRCGGEIVGEEYFPIGTQDFEALLSHVTTSGADVFVPYAAGVDQLNLLTQFTCRGLKQRMAVVMGHYDEAMVAALPPEVREGLYSSNTYFMTVDTPENTRFLERLARFPGVTGIWPKGNGVLTNFGEGTYVCVHAFAAAVQAARSLDREAIVGALEHVRMNSPQGRVIMDPLTHHAHVQTYLSRCEADGTFTIVEDFGCNAPVIPTRYQTRKNAPEAVPTPRAEPEPGFLDEVLTHVDSAIIATNECGQITLANRNACRLFGYEPQELDGLHVNALLPPHLRARHSEALKEFAQTGPTDVVMGQRGEITGYRKDGSFFPAEASISKADGPNGKIFIATIRDTTERKERERELVWQATHDPLTRLPNRMLIHDRLSNALARSTRTGQLVSLMFIDLDEFKLINDNYGHDAGDQLLVRIAQRLLDVVRRGDTVARFGGDEFLVVCDQISDETILPALAARILDVVRKPIDVAGNTIFPTVSIGLAIGNGKTNTAEDLLRNADAAMYSAKAKGRDGWARFDDSIGETARQHLETATGLRQAVHKRELEVFYQPIVDLGARAVVGMEALLRWRHRGAYIPPSEFIRVAEMTGSIIELGRWVFEAACRFHVELTRARGAASAPYISINLSGRQLAENSLVADFKSIVRETGVDPEGLVLEITETILMLDVEGVQQRLLEFGDLGIRLALDDFGTGYSSLGRITSLPIDIVKIDRAFVRDIERDARHRIIASAIVQMAKALGLTVTAEGIETPTQFDILKKLGCQHGQGFLFSRPVPGCEILAALRGIGA